MGTDKGLILLQGKPMVQWVIEGMRHSVNELFIITDKPAYKQFSMPVIEDEIKNAGPAAAIYTVLQHSQTSLNFILSCDTPMINKPTVEFLIEHTANYQITVPVFNGFAHPLFGIYATNCKEEWKKLMDKGVFKILDLISNFDVLKPDVSQHPLFKEILFTNLNTTQDLDNLVRKLESGN